MAIGRAQAPKVEVIGLSMGRKGLANYLRLLSGGVVKIMPCSNGGASESQATAKRLKVICGANTGYLDNEA